MAAFPGTDGGDPRLAEILAAEYCGRGGSDCLWYHGSWKLLKSLGVVSSSEVHAADLVEMLERVEPGLPTHPRILLSGSTDETLLKILASCGGSLETSADITALDICGTPLALTSRYAREHRLDVSTVCTDILQYCPAEGYDLIMTHAFMGNFDESGRKRLVEKWVSILNEGGSVVTVQRIRPADSSPVSGFSTDQARAFVDAAVDAAMRADYNPVEQAAVAAAAAEFAARFSSYAIRSRTEFERLFLAAGLNFHYLEYRSLEKKGNLGGPSVPSGGEYAFVIAKREKP